MSLCVSSRRQFLLGSASLAAWAFQPRIASALSNHDPRLLVLNLRGGMDGLGVVQPIGDPQFSIVRAKSMDVDHQLGAVIPLDNFFSLHPAMPTLGKLYNKGDVLFIHAVSTPYKSRSHFDAQDLLESGLPNLGASKSGWLNRAISTLPKGEGLPPKQGLALSSSLPLLLRGDARILSWMPPGFAPARQDTKQRLLNLYDRTDEAMHAAMEASIMLEEVTGGERAMLREMKAMHERAKGQSRTLFLTAQAATKLLLDPMGPRIGAMELEGWDTHVGGHHYSPRFIALLQRLDQVIGVLQRGLAPVWDQTVLCIMTEFGRTAEFNGTKGTDHGVGTLSILIGGAVKGGRVQTDWPGLRKEQLFEGRDLLPTTDIRSVFKGVLADHLGIPEKLLAQTVFPQSRNIAPMRDTIS
ncbi:DUF1501 domain-containing protein [Flexibacterium corallicola]|uniref:DUF1501 domain-containing protein n=1 Tax=Flexibacterium corallicola TaxID=3037259 RepID=UPI00286FAEB0|nr:DUF1501 domain-containing protein [Pseudovibrio sp. M1P-2-3]